MRVRVRDILDEFAAALQQELWEESLEVGTAVSPRNLPSIPFVFRVFRFTFIPRSVTLWIMKGRYAFRWVTHALIQYT